VRLEGATFIPGGQAVSIGRREGVVLAARYLQSLGHRRLALIALSSAMVDDVRDAVGADWEMLDCSSAGLDLDAARDTVRRWLEGVECPTAIICPNDVVALAALRECACRGVPVPQRVSLIGFGDSGFARHSYPALSTVRVAAAEVGRRLAEAVFAAIEGLDAPSAVAPVKLIIRETTAPPAELQGQPFAAVPRGT